MRTSICDIASHPAAFYDKTVVIEGCILTDGIERVALIDKSCPNTGISIGESERLLPAQRGILEGVGRPGAAQLCGTFSGTFRAVTKAGNVVVDTDILEVDSVKPGPGSP
jgi:hypothetical protein